VKTDLCRFEPRSNRKIRAKRIVEKLRGKSDVALMNKKTYKRHLKAVNMARLLALAEEDVGAGHTQPIRSFLKDFKRGRKVSRCRTAESDVEARDVYRSRQSRRSRKVSPFSRRTNHHVGTIPGTMPAVPENEMLGTRYHHPGLWELPQRVLDRGQDSLCFTDYSWFQAPR